MSEWISVKDQSNNHQANGQQAQAPSYNGYSQNGQHSQQGYQSSNQANYQPSGRSLPKPDDSEDLPF